MSPTDRTTEEGRRRYNARQVRWRHKNRAKGKVPDHLHGTEGAYVAYMCRCDACRAASTAAMNARRARRRAEPVPDHVHGTRNGYIAYGCRCDACAAANLVWKREYDNRESSKERRRELRRLKRAAAP